MSDETTEQKIATAEGHVKGVEEAADRGLLNRRQAERLIGVSQKVNHSHDLARGIGQRGE